MDLILDLRVRIAVILFTAISISGFGQKSMEVQSPDSNLKVNLGLKNGKLLYDIHYKEQIFLEESPLGLKTSLDTF